MALSSSRKLYLVPRLRRCLLLLSLAALKAWVTVTHLREPAHSQTVKHSAGKDSVSVSTVFPCPPQSGARAGLINVFFLQRDGCVGVVLRVP